MQIIKNKKEWTEYKKLQDNRVTPLEATHNPDSPLGFPVIVITQLIPEGYKNKINHNFVYIKDAKDLIKCN